MSGKRSSQRLKKHEYRGKTRERANGDRERHRKFHDRVNFGQTATLRLTAFNQRTTPVIDGKVLRVSADLTTDQHTGAGYYTTRTSVPSDQTPRQALHVVSGMPLKPFLKQTPELSCPTLSNR
jgi:hypothetical protein